MSKESRGLRRGLVGVLVFGLALAAGIVWIWHGPSSRYAADQQPLEGLQVFGEIPDFSLAERSGQEVRLSDLHGKVWVATFFFSRCQDICPVQTTRMASLQAEFAGASDLRLVSITVDPDHDTPPVLARYVAEHRADPRRWLFLSGEKAAIARLAVAGFRMSVANVGGPTPGARGPVIPHSSRLVLVDRAARIRGYYASGDAEAVERLRRDVATLLRAGRQRLDLSLDQTAARATSNRPLDSGSASRLV